MNKVVAGGAVVVVLAAALTQCRPSASSLEDRTKDKPGVLNVVVVDNGGEDDIPFTELPWVVTVTMVASPTEQEVIDVVEEYVDDIEDGHVESLSIHTSGERRSDFSLGAGSGKRFELWTEAFTDGLTNPAVAAITVDPWEDEEFQGSAVQVSLVPRDFATWSRTIAYYDGTFDLADLSVNAGPFTFSACSNCVNADLARSRAQMRVARLVHRRYGLVGADVPGRFGPLRLRVASGTDLADVRAYVSAISRPGTGRIVVRSS